MNMEGAFKLASEIDNHIKSHGQTIITVDDPSGIHPPFAYTVGNHALGFPELLILDFLNAADRLNDLHHKMVRRGKPFDDQELVSFGGRFPVRIQVAPEVAKSKYTLLASSRWGSSYAVMQVVVPDLAGRFPNDPAYDTSLPKQVISRLQ